MNETQAGCVVGWILSKDGSTDDFVDFGIFDRDSERARAFVNDFEDRILLDFNVANSFVRDPQDPNAFIFLPWIRAVRTGS